jgi:group II intron reverse transcriptase/maturase
MKGNKAVMETGLERIAAKARCDAKLKFTSLAHHITPELLRKSLDGMPMLTGVGVDKMDVGLARETFETWGPEVIDSIHRMGYSAPPVRRVYIPKPGKSEKRPIGVPTVIDRSIQKTVSEILSQIYEADFISGSFGGRPGRGTHQALATMQDAISAHKVSWVYEADLKNFFGSLDHGWVMRFVEHRVGDPRILSLIRRWLKAGIMEGERFEEADRGTPQGGPISVLLSNLYLHYVLDLWIEKVVKPLMKGEVHYIRYLDDFVLCFQYKTDADRFRKVLPHRLIKFGLELEPSKTKLLEFGRFARIHRNKRKLPLNVFSFLGFTVYCGLNKNGNFKVGLKTEKKRLNRSLGTIKARIFKNRHLALREQVRAINSYLRGHYRYYGIAGNSDALERVYHFTYCWWRRGLSSRSQTGYVNWEKYTKIISHYPILKPRIYLSYNEMVELAKL